MIYHITPVPKPRMTNSDKWRKRPCVLRYRAFREEVQLKIGALPLNPFHVTFIIKMPKSRNMEGIPHRRKPDIDNLLKALFDAIYKDDSHIDDVRATKVWGKEAAIKIEEIG